MRNNRTAFGATYFKELEPLAHAIAHLKPADPLTRELLAKDDDMRKALAEEKRRRRMERNRRLQS
jgi:hypothetical protein